jgi:hypothetical protein
MATQGSNKTRIGNNLRTRAATGKTGWALPVTTRVVRMRELVNGYRRVPPDPLNPLCQR